MMVQWTAFICAFPAPDTSCGNCIPFFLGQTSLLPLAPISCPLGSVDPTAFLEGLHRAMPGQSCDWLRQVYVTQMGTVKVNPETAWNNWESALAFLVRYELGAAWDTVGRENCMRMKSSHREAELRETEERLRSLFKHFHPAMPKVRYHPRTLQ